MSSIIEARKALYTGQTVERRLRPFEVREWLDESSAASTEPISHVGLRGYASTTEEPYPVTDWLGEYHETICRGAFTKALQERQDVRLLVNHDGIPVARTKSGTMALNEDERGLLVDVPSLDVASPLVQSLRSAMQRGDIDQMSFSFRATRQEWNEDYTERFVREVKLYDVSVVTYPANEGTDVKLRSALPYGTLDRLAAGLPLTDEDRTALRPLIGEVPEEAPAPAVTDRRLAQLRAMAASL